MRLFASVLLTSSVSAYEINRRPFSAATDCDAYNQYSKDAVGFLKAWNDEAQALFNEESKASWEQATNITDANGEAEKEAAKKSAAWTETIGKCAISFFGALVDTCELDMNSISCSLTDEVCNDCGDNVEFGKQSWTKVKQLRGLKMLQDLGTAILGADSEEFKTLQDSLSNMGTVYSSTKVKDQNSDRQHPLDPDLTAILIDQSTGAGPQCAYEKQKYYWDQWNTHVGTKCIDDYETFVTMGNKAAEDNGYDDMGDSWRSNYEDPEFQKHLEEIWTGTSEKRGVKDLYELVHGYIRWKLNERYGDERVSKNNDPIPDHIFGNMWAQTWGALYDVAAPYPDAGDRPDATPEIQKMEVETMFDYSDEFFRSLGMTPMTKNFWRNSVLEKRTDVENMVCHASAWDFMMGDGNHDDGAMGDYRIKMCTVKNQDDFITIHHEMGHIQYYQQYAHHPIMFRSGANPGFHEAIGDTLALAVSTPKHLQEVGLLGDDIPESDEADMNYLMSILLDKITFLPFGYLMDLYRWEIFEGSVKKEDYQKRWDELRREYQGIMPPNDRSFEDAFDAAGKYHIPNNTPYIRYFVSFIVQFQFYEKMCTDAGQFNPSKPEDNPLYKCDFFNSKEAGNGLKNVLQKGLSQPWQETMKEFLCEAGDKTCVGEMDPESLLKYFAPIEKWLTDSQKANNWVVGWDKNSEWKPCGYSEDNKCEVTEDCSTDEDWDPSWGAVETTTTTSTTTTTTTSDGIASKVSVLFLVIAAFIL